MPSRSVDRGVLRVDRQHVRARRRQRRVDQRRNRDLEPRCRREAPVLHVIERPLDEVDIGCQAEPAGELLAIGAGDDRQRRQRQVHLGERALGTVVRRAPAQLRGQRHRIAEREGRLRIDARHDQWRRHHPAVGEPHTARLCAVGDHRHGSRADDDRHTGGLGRLSQGFGQGAGSASWPHAAGVAGDVVGGVEQEQQTAARRPRPEHAAEDAVGRQRRPQQRRVGELGDQIGHRHRPPAQQPVAVVAAEPAELSRRAQQPPQFPCGRRVDRRRRRGEDRRDDPAEGAARRP